MGMLSSEVFLFRFGFLPKSFFFENVKKMLFKIGRYLMIANSIHHVISNKVNFPELTRIRLNVGDFWKSRLKLSTFCLITWTWICN